MTPQRFAEKHHHRKRRRLSEDSDRLQHQAVNAFPESSSQQTANFESTVLQASNLKHDFSDVPIRGAEQSFPAHPMHPFLLTSYPLTTDRGFNSALGLGVAQLSKKEDSDIHTDFGKSCTLQALALITPHDQKTIAKLFSNESLDYTEDKDIRKMLPKLGFTRVIQCDGNYADHHMGNSGGTLFVMIMTGSGSEGHMLAATYDKKNGSKITDYQRNDFDAKLYKSDRVEIWKYK